MGSDVQIYWQNPGDPSDGVDLGIAVNQKGIRLSIVQAGLPCALLFFLFFIKMQNGGIHQKKRSPQ